jgi:tRNA(Ile)-lysidine synthetase-like protein
MQGDLAQRILRFIERHRMLRPGDRVGLAVSGGADSVALLRLVQESHLQLGVYLCVLHFNHQLRGADSDADEQFVAGVAAEQGLEFFPGQQDVAAEARAQKWNLEDAARRMRYAFFRSAVERLRLHRVAVAHTADDQAETVLARLVRGTGPAGLAAIYPVKGHVVRPLIEIRRGELREYLARIGQAWREDLSNRDLQRLRARLRHQVLPVVERELQPAIVEHLCSLAQLSREDEAFWQALVRERLRALVRREGGRIGIRAADLLMPMMMPVAMAAVVTGDTPAAGANMEAGKDAQVALTRRLVRGIIEELRGDCRRLTAQHVEQVLGLAAPTAGGNRTALPGMVVQRCGEWIWFELANEGTPQGIPPSKL